MNTNAAVGSLARHALTVAATYLVSNGMIDAAQAEIVVGIGMGVVALAWSFFEKHNRA